MAETRIKMFGLSSLIVFSNDLYLSFIAVTGVLVWGGSLLFAIEANPFCLYHNHTFLGVRSLVSTNNKIAL